VRGPALVVGQFEGIAHSTEGRAAVVALPSGERKVTLTSFETDAGPDLRVYVVPGRTSGDSVDRGTDVGALKGNVGNQQYTLPASFDLAGGGTVVIWCERSACPSARRRSRRPSGPGAHRVRSPARRRLGGR
jgi:electron transfer DM13